MPVEICERVTEAVDADVGDVVQVVQLDPEILRIKLRAPILVLPKVCKTRWKIQIFSSNPEILQQCSGEFLNLWILQIAGESLGERARHL